MSESRKNDHIDLTFSTRPKFKANTMDLNYEPLFSAHPNHLNSTKDIEFIGYRFKLPLWVSSMTGGAVRAEKINHNLAKACGEFKFGMGLGSCRVLLEDNSRIKDFDVKDLMPDMPLFSNFGIAQLEILVDEGKLDQIKRLNSSLGLDGLIIHVNPLQEWAQPEGDNYKKPPIDTIKRVLDNIELPIIVKEVGQGFGPKSLDALSKLPLAAIETAAFGGTNFTNIELARLNGNKSGRFGPKMDVGAIGNTNLQMIEWINNLDQSTMKCSDFIISGGISSVVEGHSLIRSCKYNSIMGMASSLLKHAMNDYEELKDYLNEFKSTHTICDSFLK